MVCRHFTDNVLSQENKMALLPVALPQVPITAGNTSDWIDISGLVNIAIHVEQATGGGASWAADISNTTLDAVNVASAIAASDVIGNGGGARNASIRPFPVGVRWFRVAATGLDVLLNISGQAPVGSWRTSKRQ